MTGRDLRTLREACGVTMGDLADALVVIPHRATGVCKRRNASLCRGCNAEVDRDTCHCGSSYAAHLWEEHSFVPSGCVCYLRVTLCDGRDRGNCEVTQ